MPNRKPLRRQTFIGDILLGRDVIINFTYEITNPGCEAQTYGPPEKCYPAEDMEYEVRFHSIAEDIGGGKEIPLECPGWLATWLDEYLCEMDVKVYDAIIDDLEGYDDDL